MMRLREEPDDTRRRSVNRTYLRYWRRRDVMRHDVMYLHREDQLNDDVSTVCLDDSQDVEARLRLF